MKLNIVLTVAALAFMGTAEGRWNPSSFCDLSCVKNIYNTYCGGATCGQAMFEASMLGGICTRRCVDALSGRAMQTCLQSAGSSAFFFKAEAAAAASIYSQCISTNHKVDFPHFPHNNAEAPKPAPKKPRHSPKKRHYGHKKKHRRSGPKKHRSDDFDFGGDFFRKYFQNP